MTDHNITSDLTFCDAVIHGLDKQHGGRYEINNSFI